MINHKHKILFIHIPKTAGRSLENYLHSLGIHAEDSTEKYSDHTLIQPHSTIKDYLNIYGDQIKSYFWFTIIRNPFDRILSEYFYSKGKKLISCSFRDFLIDQHFVDKTYINHELRQIDFISNNEKSFDFIGRFENLHNDLSELFSKLNLPFNNFPHINSSQHNNYGAYYNNETFSFVRSYFFKDLCKFNYQF